MNIKAILVGLAIASATLACAPVVQAVPSMVGGTHLLRSEWDHYSSVLRQTNATRRIIHVVLRLLSICILRRLQVYRSAERLLPLRPGRATVLANRPAESPHRLLSKFARCAGRAETPSVGQLRINAPLPRLRRSVVKRLVGKSATDTIEVS